MIKERIQQWNRYRRAKELYEKYERVLIPGALFFGVIVDFVTFHSLAIRSTFMLLGVYALIAGFAIGFIHIKESPDLKILRYPKLAAPLVLQFAFGALLSMSFIFYWFSGSISVSWPLILIVIFLMISNEIFRQYYQRLTVQISVFFFILFSFFSLTLPFLLNSISALVFLLSGLTALAVMTIYLRMLISVLPDLKSQLPTIKLAVFLIFALMNIFYLSNIIPPIPLSIREAGVYHSIEHIGNEYKLIEEKESWLQKLIPGQTIHTDNRAYVFTSIFAPADLDTKIYHQWNYYDEKKEKWIEKDRLSFTINGGRDSGYRGFSLKSSLEPGKWRVDVETRRGQILGRVKFTVKPIDKNVELEEIIK